MSREYSNEDTAKPVKGVIAVAPPSFRRERALIKRGIWPVAGCDEAGRGPLAGPVVAAAVVLDPDRVPDGLADSKALSAARREELLHVILTTAQVGVACVSHSEIDAINIRQASRLAISRALAALPCAPDFALVDGNDPPPLPCDVEAIVKGDATVASIAAASIVAKVVRDRMMRRLALLYPAYGFETNVGYATAVHREALEAHGPCPFHRRSFAPIRQDRLDL
jgi:ribonuclease HII